MSKESSQPFFAPQLIIDNGVKDVSFYVRAFGATENLKFTNDDGSIHVVEFSIHGTLFHLHELTSDPAFFTPQKYSRSTVLIGLFVADVDAVMKAALEAGAVEISPARDYEYGYRQGRIRDPFGHYWMIQQKV